MDKIEINFDDFARMVSTDPKQYESDTIELVTKIMIYTIKYGELGFKGLLDFLK